MELLLIVYLLPYLIYLLDSQPPIMLRENEVITQDIAQLLTYGFEVEEIPLKGRTVWIDGEKFYPCEYEFKYCTKRKLEEEVRICSAECLQ